jgi:hypothetical protein
MGIPAGEYGAKWAVGGRGMFDNGKNLPQAREPAETWGMEPIRDSANLARLPGVMLPVNPGFAWTRPLT